MVVLFALSEVGVLVIGVVDRGCWSFGHHIGRSIAIEQLKVDRMHSLGLANAIKIAVISRCASRLAYVMGWRLGSSLRGLLDLIDLLSLLGLLDFQNCHEPFYGFRNRHGIVLKELADFLRRVVSLVGGHLNCHLAVFWTA